MRKVYYTIGVLLLTIFLYQIVGTQIDNLKKLKFIDSIPKEKKIFIYKYFFPYKYQKVLQRENDQFFLQYELNTIKLSEYIRFEGPKKLNIFDQYLDLVKITNSHNLTAGINNNFPGSAYIDFNNDQLFLVSSRGLVAFFDKFEAGETLKFKLIPNNIASFINIKQFIKNKWFSIKDVLIDDGKIYVSYTKELKDNCWNTSIIVAKIQTDLLNFKELFSPKECVKEKDEEKDFNGHQSGGRMVRLDKMNILLSVGEYRKRFKAQEKDSVFGKILKINKSNGDYEVVSIGHRNPQGMLINKKKNFIISTEHGPKGGDEININVNPFKNISNFGWPISSYGEHYACLLKKNKKIYEKYPLNKNHKQFGFIEPAHYFVPYLV